MKNILTFIALILFILLVSACALQTDVIPPFVGSPSAEILANPSHTPTVSSYKPSKTPTPTITSTLTPGVNAMKTQGVVLISAIEKCATIYEQIPLNNEIEGTLLLYNNDESKSYYFDISSNERRPAPLPTNISPYFEILRETYYSLSPDGKWFAYLEYTIDETGHREKTRRLRMLDVNGRKYDLSFWGLDWQWLIGWVDNQRIALFNPKYSEGTVTILNPFSEKWEDVLPSFPHVPSISYSYHGIPKNIYYNKYLSYVAYVEDADDWQTIIYDVKNKKVVWKGNKDLFGRLEWSPDGTKIALEKRIKKGQMGLVSINLDGEETLLSISTDIIYSIKFSWSPNSKLIAAWLDSSSSKKSLSVIDQENNTITNFCIEMNGGRGYSPRWSPDNNFVAVPVIDDKKHMWTTIILDIQTGQAYRLGDDEVVFGWMVEP